MASHRSQVAVIGNIGLDTNVYLPGRDVDWSVEANFTDNQDYVGQAGGYASRGYAQLGYRTTFVGYVGDDFGGQQIRHELAQDGIDTAALFIDPTGTSRSVNIMYQDGRRKNFYDAKAHMTLAPDLDVCRQAMAGCRLAHFNIPNWARHLLLPAKELGLKIACDLQDVVDPNDPYRQDFIRHADILFFSAANHGDPRPLIKKFLRGHPGRIVVSGMGSKGCAVGQGTDIQLFPPITMAEPIVDTNGAGDGLAVGFLSSYVLEGFSLEDALRRGQITARHTCSQRASTSALITREKLDRVFKVPQDGIGS
ncbi:MAG: carbohydrate kinase family protein [Holophaga sp.]|nr:carbohydrate kinase family protein [Holophaga sp.]